MNNFTVSGNFMLLLCPDASMFMYIDLPTLWLPRVGYCALPKKNWLCYLFLYSCLDVIDIIHMVLFFKPFFSALCLVWHLWGSCLNHFTKSRKTYVSASPWCLNQLNVYFLSINLNIVIFKYFEVLFYVKTLVIHIQMFDNMGIFSSPKD